MENRAYHWLIALVVATLVHAAVALALVRTPPPEVARRVLIAIDLAPDSRGDGGQAGSGAEDNAGATTDDAAKDARADQPPDVHDEPEPQPSRTPDLRAEAKPEQTLSSESTTDLTPPSNSVPPRPKPEPAVVKTAAPRPKVVETPKPKPKPAVTRKPKPRVAAEQADGTDLAVQSRAGTDKSGQTARGHVSGTGAGKGCGRGTAPGSAKSPSSYHGQLAAWLNRHKRYPPAARRNRQTGTVRVTFTIDRNGRVLSKRIVASSGHAALDNEVEAMLRRASPMPKIPQELGRSTLTVTLPVVFNLR